VSVNLRSEYDSLEKNNSLLLQEQKATSILKEVDVETKIVDFEFWIIYVQLYLWFLLLLFLYNM
jgi:hypothetical protein